MKYNGYECFFLQFCLNRNFWHFFFQNIKRNVHCLSGHFMLNEFAWEICTWHVNYIELRPCTHFEHVLFIHLFYQWKKNNKQFHSKTTHTFVFLMLYWKSSFLWLPIQFVEIAVFFWLLFLLFTKIIKKDIMSLCVERKSVWINEMRRIKSAS